MLRASVGVEAGLDPQRTAERAAAAALGALSGRPEAALVFASAAWGPAAAEVLTRTAEVLEAREVIGSTCVGLLAEGREFVDNPAVGVLAIAGGCARSLLLDELAGHEERGAADLGDWVPSRTGEGRGNGNELVVLLADGLRVAAEPLLCGIGPRLGASRLVGAGTLGGSGCPPLVLHDREVSAGAAAAIAIEASGAEVRVESSAAGQLRGQAYEVTEVWGNWVRRLGGASALEVLSHNMAGLREEEISSQVLVSLLSAGSAGPAGSTGSTGSAGASGSAAEEDRASPCFREIVGIDRSAGSFALPQGLEPGAQIRFALRDSAAAAGGLERSVGRVAASEVAFLLQLGCGARGHGLLGPPGTESALLAQALGGRGPFLGVRAGTQMGPSQLRDPDLLTHGSVVATIANEIA